MATTSHFILPPARRQVGLFILLVLALGVGLAIFPALTPFYMFSPALAVLLTLIPSQKICTSTSNCSGLTSECSKEASSKKG